MNQKVKIHFVKSVRIRCFSGPYFPAYKLNTNQKNSEYGHFSRRDSGSSDERKKKKFTEEILNEKLHFLCSVQKYEDEAEITKQCG